jgi:hypothetical protein
MASLWLAARGGKYGLVAAAADPYNAVDTNFVVLHAQESRFTMEKEYIDRAKAIREGILQLRDSL